MSSPETQTDTDVSALQETARKLSEENETLRHLVVNAVIVGVIQEWKTATTKWPPFNSAHEAFAILMEEAHELWDHVRMNQKSRNLEAMKKEAIQVAAMAVRFALEVCDEERGRK